MQYVLETCAATISFSGIRLSALYPITYSSVSEQREMLILHLLLFYILLLLDYCYIAAWCHSCSTFVTLDIIIITGIEM